MSHEEWLEWRRNGIGGSDAPAIMGVSPWATPFQKWEEKVLSRSNEDNAAKRFGRETEGASRIEFESYIGKTFMPMNVQNTSHLWLKASLDGIDESFENIVEIKKANKEDHATAKSGKIPEKYYPQCQHILNVTGMPGMYYFSSPADGSKGVIVEVARDSSYIETQLFPKEKEFWEFIKSNKAPPLTEKDFNEMGESEEWKALASTWIEKLLALRDVEAAEKEIRNQMIGLADGKSSRGSRVSLTRSVVSGSIDYMQAFSDYVDNLKAHYPDIPFKPISVEPYRKPSFVKWTARVTS
jgi:putative phage-type endonuclease